MADRARNGSETAPPSRFGRADVLAHIRYHHPGCPPHAVKQVAKRVCGRDWFGTTLGAAVGITINAYLRHEKTNYETLLEGGIARADALREVAPKLKRAIRTWAQPRETWQAEPTACAPTSAPDVGRETTRFLEADALDVIKRLFPACPDSVARMGARRVAARAWDPASVELESAATWTLETIVRTDMTEFEALRSIDGIQRARALTLVMPQVDAIVAGWRRVDPAAREQDAVAP